MIRNQRFKNALLKVPQDIPPIWFMRQAGRYHNHYQSLKKKYTFEQLCKNFELASEVACGPISDFDYDVAILFSDILFPLEHMGLNLKYKPGPIFDSYFNENSINKIKPIDAIVHELSFQSDALIETRKRLPAEKSLVGFVGGPWTLLSYGLGIKNIEEEKIDPLKNKFHEKLLYEIILPVTMKTIEMQLNSQAEIVYIFDTNAKQLKNNYFLNIYFAKLKENIFKRFPDKIAYFCKDNPLLNDPSSIKIEFDNFLNRFLLIHPKDRSGWICSLNHGVLPKSRESNVKYFIEKIRESFANKS